MPVLGVTGGIATGKSTFVRTFLCHLDAALFDADRCAHELLDRNATVIGQVRSVFGEEVFDRSGKLSRTRLRDLIFANESRRRTLEAILHPVIRQRWPDLAEACREAGSWLVVDLPLLFETAAETAFDRTVVVASSLHTQQHRLREHRGLNEPMIAKIVGAQLPLGAKIKQADHVIWNDSSISCLDAQARILARWLKEYYG